MTGESLEDLRAVIHQYSQSSRDAGLSFRAVMESFVGTEMMPQPLKVGKGGGLDISPGSC